MPEGALIKGIVVAFLTVAFLVFVFRPRLGVFAWTSLLGVELEFTRELVGAYLSPADFVLIPTFLGVSGYLAAGKRDLPRLTVTPYIWLLIGVFTVGLIPPSLHGSVTAFVLYNRYFGLIAFAIMTLTVVTSISPGGRETVKLAKVLVYSGSVLNLTCLGLYYAWLAFGFRTEMVTPDGRLAGFLLDATAHGAYLTVVLLFQLAFTLNERRLLPRLFGAVNLLALVGGILLTFGRTAWVSLLAGGVALAFLYRDRLRESAAVAAVILTPLVLVAASAFWLSDYEWAELIWRTSTVERRFEQIAAGLALWEDAPVFGIGLGRFLVVSQGLLEEPNIIHNTFVWILVETGIIGLMVFACFVFRLFRTQTMMTAASQHEHAVVRATVAALVANLTFMLGVEGLYQRHFWFLVVVTELLVRRARVGVRTLDVANPGTGRYASLPRGGD